MRNLKVFIAYNGAAYHGFQRQDNALTVQEVVEKAIGKLLKIEPPVILGCSRTDTGVHARRFCFNVRVDSAIPCNGFVKGMNTLLPGDVAVLSCEDAEDDFHARFCTKAKEYVYLINCAPTRDVFMRNLAYHYPYPLDISKMNAAARLLVGEHDFAAFCRAEGKVRVKTTVRTIYSLEVHKNGNICEIKIRGNGFLYNMVRIVAGTLIYVSEGRLSLSDVQRALETGDRELAGKTLPPEGLYLNEVSYEEQTDCKAELLRGLDKLRITEQGRERVKNNLALDTDDVLGWCREFLTRAVVTKKGKNYYAAAEGCTVTINAGSLTIITAHRQRITEPFAEDLTKRV
ncbi:MAG: tRNA pseudouridine(38-40) synthase TruA [Oscillospiraceae bacterium]|nr:tRNA pseudouridine(38-40) synthase TruA [Oscillospiraceae bacterium]